LADVDAPLGLVSTFDYDERSEFDLVTHSLRLTFSAQRVSSDSFLWGIDPSTELWRGDPMEASDGDPIVTLGELSQFAIVLWTGMTIPNWSGASVRTPPTVTLAGSRQTLHLAGSHLSRHLRTLLDSRSRPPR
jgi:hypothetical protein